jgi:hypothetical protein
MKGELVMADEPPIMVGGGGSTYIWIKKGLTLTPKPYPQDPPPEYDVDDFDATKYDCYDVAVDLTGCKTHDGDNEGSLHKVKVRKKHCTRFYDSSK